MIVECRVADSSGINFSAGHEVTRDPEVEFDYYHYGLGVSVRRRREMALHQRP